MSERLHPGAHPDPDSLNAFIEGALPGHERAEYLAHLAECARCREVLFLAQETPSATTPRQPHTGWRRSMAAPRILLAAAAMCVSVVAIWLYLHAGGRPRAMLALLRTAPPSRPRIEGQANVPQVAQAVQLRALPAATPVPKTAPPEARGALSTELRGMTPASVPALHSLEAPRLAQSAHPPPPSPLPSAPYPPAQSLSVGLRDLQAASPRSEISGTVTDANGAAVAGAAIKVRQFDGTVTADASTDSTGDFRMALPAGRYELQIGAQGFRETSRQVDLQPRETASINSRLEKASALEKARVTSVAAALPSAFAAVLSGISGTVTDPTGAAISGATIKIRQLGGTITTNARTDTTGQFDVEPLPAGRYELQIGAPGFRETLSEVDLQPRQAASVKTQLEIGSVSETVEVTATASTIQTATASLHGGPSPKIAAPQEPRPLPGKLPAVSTVASGKNLLSVDSAGAVFCSGNSGRDWKTVKPVWTGKVSAIAPADPSQNAMFQIITDSGSVWLSRDGAHWRPATPRN